MSELDVQFNYAFPGVSDAFGIAAQVDALRECIGYRNQMLQLERQCAMDIHRARGQAIEQSDALKIVFGTDTEEVGDGPTLKAILSSAFKQTVEGASLPEGFAKLLAKQLRTELHPDRGGDEETAKSLGELLVNIEEDEIFVISSAVIAANHKKAQTVQDLRDERYKLTLVSDSIKTVFESPEELEAHKEREVGGVEWLLRTEAANRTLGIILGSPEQWRGFLDGIARQHNFYLINMVNSMIPEIRRIQERIQKGDPIVLSDSQVAEVDKIIERVWTTLDPKSLDGVYQPPYQNWLEVVLPMLRILDPGEKPGETYTFFPKPIQLLEPPRTILPVAKKELYKEEYGSKIIHSNRIANNLNFSEYRDY